MPVRIFLLDDEEMLCDIFQEYLTSDQIQITTFTDPKKAIKACEIEPPTMFFIDYRLPSITGDEVALSVDENIIKILITGDYSIKAKYQFDKIISKPYHFDEIKKVIKEYI
jgi:DNA-binding NtrC family response regulator